MTCASVAATEAVRDAQERTKVDRRPFHRLGDDAERKRRPRALSGQPGGVERVVRIRSGPRSRVSPPFERPRRADCVHDITRRRASHRDPFPPASSARKHMRTTARRHRESASEAVRGLNLSLGASLDARPAPTVRSPAGRACLVRIDDARARSSVGERSLHTREVAGSSPAVPIEYLEIVDSLRYGVFRGRSADLC